MSKKIRTLVMILILATMTSTGAFADTNTVNTTYDSHNEAIALQEDSFVYVRDSNNNPVIKTLSPVGDGTRLYNSKLGKSTLSVNNVVGAGREDHKTMLWAKGPVTVNFSGTNGRYIFQYDKLMYRVSGGRVVFIRPQMDNLGYISGAREKDYLKELPFQADYQTDKAITLTEPGLYKITDSSYGEGGNECLLYVGNNDENLNLAEAKIENAVPTSLVVQAIGKTASLPAYNINGENYIRTEDLATILYKTTRQFNKTDNYAKTTNNNIVTGSIYTPNGSELKALPSENAVATPYTETVMLNNVKVQPSIYTINNEQFISLSDMNSFLNLGLSVNGNVATMSNVTNVVNATGKITVDVLNLTDKDYDPYGGPTNLIPSYKKLNIKGLTDEQIKEKIKGFDTKIICIYTDISDKLRAELKQNYKVE